MLALQDSVPDWWQAVLDFLDAHPNYSAVLAPLILLVLWLLLLLVGRRLLLAFARRVVKHTATTWDDLLIESRLLHRLSHLIPLAFVLVIAETLPLDEDVALWIDRIARASVTVVIVASLHALFEAADLGYQRKQAGRRRSIRGYVQLAKLVATLVGGAIAVATLSGSDVSSLITGIGVSTAVVLFVFKDTILSFIASIHLTAYDMVRVGDWIEMPNNNADGDVVDVALHTVKVQNWDKTITTIPTFELYSQSFKNWRGMEQGDGRRIKRSLFIDIGSIRFLDDADIQRLSQIGLIHDYLASKATATLQANAALSTDASETDRRRLTNVGTFRAYCLAYLRQHPEVNQEMTLLVRQMPSSERGLPIELYLFTKSKAWDEYERIQADIFDHLLAVVDDFDLRIFQLPAGSDLSGLVATSSE